MTTKTIFQLNIDDYQPEVTALTYPRVEEYAAKIGADVVRITERKYPDYPLSYEKFQIYDLSSSEWNIYLDSDFLIHPEMFDLTEYVPKERVLISNDNVAVGRYRPDKYFRRDGRNTSVSTNIVMVSDWCMDLWKPTDLTRDQVAANIYELPRENFTGDTAWRIDDYIVSRNIAKYGLLYEDMHSIYRRLFGHTSLEFYYHPHGEGKYNKIFDKLGAWSLNDH